MSTKLNSDLLKQRLQGLIEATRGLETTVSQVVQSLPRGGNAIALEMDRIGPDAATIESMVLTDEQRRICDRVINVFETGTIRGEYGAISIFHDGPHDIRQITYGKSQTTEYGNLRELVEMYVEAGGLFSEALRPYVPRIGMTPLVDDIRFKDLLKRAGNEDPVMRRTQDVFFDRRYFQPALTWANQNGFARALSMLVIYNSFIHSGRIREDLRARFPERPPAQGGNEQTWVRQYVDVRHNWLANHHRPAVRASRYRTRDLAREIARGNWDLAILPIMAHGVPVDGREARETGIAAGLGPSSEEIRHLGPTGAEWDDALQTEEVWSEVELAATSAADNFAVGDSAATLAASILAHPGISLATTHVSGMQDQATVRQNIEDTAAGRLARRSSYGNAPGGALHLDTRLLAGLLALAERYTFSVAELAGGSHNAHSRHYAGIAADINIINGSRVSAAHPDVVPFQTKCRDLGATEVLGPGHTGHATHIHAAWPRPV